MSIINLLFKNFQEKQLNSTRFPVLPRGILNSSKFPEVAATLPYDITEMSSNAAKSVVTQDRCEVKSGRKQFNVCCHYYLEYPPICSKQSQPLHCISKNRAPMINMT